MKVVPSRMREDRTSHPRVRCRKSQNVIDGIRSPARERRDSYVGMFSLSSRSGLQTDFVILYVSEFTADYTRLLPLTAIP